MAGHPVGSTTQEAELNGEAVEVSALTRRYGRTEALKGINLSVKAGELFGIVGPDGAGKTTLLQILSGVMPHTGGSALVFGKNPRSARHEVGYLTQHTSIYGDVSVDENLHYSARVRNVPPEILGERRQRYLSEVDLLRFKDRLAGRLSGGMRQKLALCCALISAPKVLLLDEPTTGLDPVSRREFWHLLAHLTDGGTTIIVATPQFDEAELCQRVALIFAGRISEVGAPANLRRSLGMTRLEVRSRDLNGAEQHLRRLFDAGGGSAVGGGPVGAGGPVVGAGPVAGGGSVAGGGQVGAGGQVAGAGPVVGGGSAGGPVSGGGSAAAWGAASIHVFGDRIDVLVQDGRKAQAEIETILGERLAAPHVVLLEQPTLENVFVARLENEGFSAPPAPPFPWSDGGCGIAPSSKGPGAPAKAVAIRANGLSKKFQEFQAVQGINLEIRYGEIYGLLGANGAGKTTTIRMLCGLMPPTQGELSVAGMDHSHGGKLRKMIGYMSQKFTLYDDLTVLENLRFYSCAYGLSGCSRRKKLDWVTQVCGLQGMQDTLVGKLPAGFRQRIAFATSVMHEPEILFLDEPTSGVDPLCRRQLWQIIADLARNGAAVVVTTHFLDDAEYCNRLGLMVQGELVAEGTPLEIKKQAGRMVEVSTPQVFEAFDVLSSHLDPLLLSVFPGRVHVQVENDLMDVEEIRSLLRQADVEVTGVQPIPSSLEDAFVTIVHERRQMAK